MLVAAALLVTWAAAQTIDASNDECSAHQAHGRDKAHNCLDVPVDETALLQNKAMNDGFNRIGTGACRGPGLRGVSYNVTQNTKLGRCKALCRNHPNCTAIEYKKNGDCEVHVFPTDDFKPENDVDCFKFTRSKPFRKKFDLIGKGACRGGGRRGATYTLLQGENLPDCKMHCDFDQECLGIEYKTNGDCELHKDLVDQTKRTQDATLLQCFKKVP